MSVERLSVDRCRSLLPAGSPTLSDDQVLKLRDQLYGLAQLAADAWEDTPVEYDEIPTHPRLIQEALARALGDDWLAE